MSPLAKNILTKPASMMVTRPRTRPDRMSAIQWAVLLDHMEHPESSGEERDLRVGCSESARIYSERKLQRLGFLVSVASRRRPNRYRVADGAAMPECPCCRRCIAPIARTP